MFSKELQELQQNSLESHLVIDANPVIIDYCLTAHERMFETMISEIARWRCQA